MSCETTADGLLRDWQEWYDGDCKGQNVDAPIGATRLYLSMLDEAHGEPTQEWGPESPEWWDDPSNFTDYEEERRLKERGAL